MTKLIRVAVEVDSISLYNIGTTEGKLNSWNAQKQFSTCSEEFVTARSPSDKISLRESLHYLVDKATGVAAPRRFLK